MQTPITIKYFNTDGSEKSVIFSQEQVILGGQVTSDTVLALPLDKDISTPHARLFYERELWWIENLNGNVKVYLNNAPVQRITQLPQGSIINVGNTLILIEFNKVGQEPVELNGGIIEYEYLLQDANISGSFSESEHLNILINIFSINKAFRGQSKLDNFIKYLLKLFPHANGACIALYRDKELLPLAFSPESRSELSFTLAYRAMLSRKAFIWDRTTASQASQAIPSLQAITSAVYVPIIYNRRVLGIIQVDTCSLYSTFSETDLESLSKIAALIGSSFKKETEGSLQEIPSIFISYSHANIEFVRKLAHDLRRYGISTWFDDRLRSGQDWQTQLATAIEAVDAFVIVISPTSMASEYVQWELKTAFDFQQRIFPLMYLKSNLPENLGKIQYIDISNNYDKALTELVDELYELKGNPL